MVLNSYREQADSIVKPIAEKMSGIEPNVLSWISFLFAVLAGISFFLGDIIFVILGAVFVLSNSFFDAMDGRVAKLTDKASIKGDFLDHSIDRYADIFILGGITLGPLCNTPIGLLAMIGVLMTSYMGTQAQAVGVGRDYGGIAGRADRLLLLILVPFIFVLMESYHTSSFSILKYNIGIFDILMLWFAVAGNMTAVIRGLKTWKDLD
ncbi:MAG: CDP-alcohol phosphatidyltransferase family protein [Candidatus Saliniplasma sp.]